MTGMSADRTLPWDWHPGRIPDNVHVAASAYVETSFSFLLFRSEVADAVRIGESTSIYLGTMFDVGTSGRVTFGDYALVNGARIVCDAGISIGDYALISWNVVLMDTYRVPIDPVERRAHLRRVADSPARRLDAGESARPIHIGRAAWIGFDSCVLPGVTIGEGAIVGARSVVMEDVEPFTIVVGNPARVVRRMTTEEMNDGR
ncbi:MAG TPA: acyltransferase [Vicinamibacterales bacterium]|jgi:acetyltransferase-like isoleucine patch superfamily enzyme